MNGPVYVVQFPHPGPEHRPSASVMPWNTGPHRRKFMLAEGVYGESSSQEQAGKVVFWGEWEGPSRVLRRWPVENHLPTVLHEPYLDSPPQGWRQNTDPWVFGHHFHYSNCKQRTNKGQSQTAMQDLTPGSLILFGSTIGEDFVLDTVFVVSERIEPFTPSHTLDIHVENDFRVATLESLTTGEGDWADLSFTLYWGNTPAQSINGLFSFVPCQPQEGDGPRFPRPIIRLPNMINPESRQSPSGPTRPRTVEDAAGAWESVVSQVLDQDLLLATRLELSSTPVSPLAES